MQYISKFSVDLPVVVQRQFPPFIVQKVVEVPQAHFTDQVVGVPVVMQRQVPTVSKVQISVKVPQARFIDSTVDVPVVLRIFISEASVLIDLTSKSAKKLSAEPPATVGLALLDKRAKLYAPSFCAAHPLEIEVCDRNVLREFREHSSIPKSEATVLIGLTTKSATKLMVEPPATVGLALLDKRDEL